MSRDLPLILDVDWIEIMCISGVCTSSEILRITDTCVSLSQCYYLLTDTNTVNSGDIVVAI